MVRICLPRIPECIPLSDAALLISFLGRAPVASTSARPPALAPPSCFSRSGSAPDVFLPPMKCADELNLTRTLPSSLLVCRQENGELEKPHDLLRVAVHCWQGPGPGAAGFRSSFLWLQTVLLKTVPLLNSPFSRHPRSTRKHKHDIRIILSLI